MEVTVCLNMIVKNESKIITRLFDSVLPFIDTYCICDTGSTDNTVEIITNYFKDKNINGTVIHEPFVNFSHNRNFALNSCVGMADYVLLLDADMILNTNEFKKELITEYDMCYILQGSDNFYYQNVRIVKNNGYFNYVGVTHEYMSSPNGSKTISFPKNIIFINDIGDGGSKSDKFERDVKLLTGAIKDEPNHDRYHFYLANSLHDLGRNEEAITTYKRRIEIGGWNQEVWYSYYRIGICYRNLGKIENAICAWMEGYNYLQSRVENIYEIVHHYRLISKHTLANTFYNIGKDIIKKKPNRDDYLFLHNDIYTYKLDYEYTIIAAYVGIKNINNEIITIMNVCNDDSIKDNLLRNMKFYKDVLKPCHTITFDDTVERTVNGHQIKLRSSSSCMIPKKDLSGYMLNIRYVNYYIDGGGGYLECNDNIATYNRSIDLTNEFIIKNDKWFDVKELSKRYIGVEDVRIFNASNNILFIGTGQHDNGNLGIVCGVYDTKKEFLETNEITSSFSNNSCEKNWVNVDYKNSTHIIYNWCPLKICQLNLNKIHIVEERKMPQIFNRTRGSTCGFTYKNDQTIEIWFIVHIASYEQPRHYYDMIAVFDESLNLLRYSAPFKYEDQPIQYCLSLIVKDDTVIINYSVWDRSTRIGFYNKKYIDSLLIYKP